MTGRGGVGGKAEEGHVRRLDVLQDPSLGLRGLHGQSHRGVQAPAADPHGAGPPMDHIPASPVLGVTEASDLAWQTQGDSPPPHAQPPPAGFPALVGAGQPGDAHVRPQTSVSPHGSGFSELRTQTSGRALTSPPGVS